jgi:chloride channel protein, CIC family
MAELKPTSGNRGPTWFPEILQLGSPRIRRHVRLLGFAALVGVVAGLGGIAFYVATRVVEHYALGIWAGYYPHPHPGGEPSLPWLVAVEHPFHPWLLLLIPTLGGIISGVLVFTLAPEAEGHGTDAVISAYHNKQGLIRPRVPLVKIVASTVTLGTGGSGGREGPIAQIGAGFGSLLGQILRLRPAERRVLMAAGMGAGIAAVFRAPLAGTIFAAEVLYRSPEFESEVIIPAGLASVISYCVFGAFTGWTPLFVIPVLPFGGPSELPAYLLLAIFMALLAMLYTRSFYGCKRLFGRLPIDRRLRPAIGAFLTGLVGLSLYFVFGRRQEVLAVLAFGYSSIQQAMTLDASAAAALLLAIALGKILTTSLTISSGGSGGVFGPSMVIGGCAGGALGILLHNLWPSLVPHPASFVIVGMAGFFSAAAKTPFSTLVIVSEMTGGYSLLLPSLWVCTLSYVLSDEQSIYSSQVEGRSRSPAHQGSYIREVLAGVRVSEFLPTHQTAAALHLGDSLDTIIRRLDADPYAILPVVDAQERLKGVISLEETHMALNEPAMRSFAVAEDLMRMDVRPLTTDDMLDRALELFVENDLPALPVVNDLTHRRIVGVVRQQEIASAYLHRVHGLPSADESA